MQARLRALADRAESIAKTTALEIQRAGGRDMDGIVGQREIAATREFEGASIAVGRMRRPCSELPASGRSPAGGRTQPTITPPMVAAGPWAHVEPPADVPDWVGCDGFKRAAGHREQPPGDHHGGAGHDHADDIRQRPGGARSAIDRRRPTC